MKKLFKSYEFKTDDRYDYRREEATDIYNYIHENYSDEEIKEFMTDREQFQEDLNEILWTEDSVTGNASGSYFMSTWKAEEAISHNFDLIADMEWEFGELDNKRKYSAEYLDVSIRCYLLGECIGIALDEIENEIA